MDDLSTPIISMFSLSYHAVDGQTVLPWCSRQTAHGSRQVCITLWWIYACKRYDLTFLNSSLFTVGIVA
jgi:hypothetical protein